MPVTTNALNALLYINNGYEFSRWNMPAAVGTSVENPGGIGTAVSLTYSFLSSAPAYATVNEQATFGVVSADMRNAAEAVLGHVSEVANVDFTLAGPQKGQITFATSQQADSSAYAYIPFFSPTSVNGEITSVREDKEGGNVWIDNSTPWIASDWLPGNFGYSMLLHEVGHALGLKHPFEALSADGFVLADSLDNERYTVMSYDSAPRSVVVDAGFNYSFLAPSSLMVMDIQALQYLYGANRTIRTDDTYSFGTNEEILETIWDGGGSDTLDCSNQIFGCRINLADGEYSSIGIRRTDAQLKSGLDLPSSFFLDDYDRANLYNGVDNLGIAKGAIIENAYGGSAADTMLGNSVANRLVGGAGSDKVSGGTGNDRLEGQSGNDVLVGGTGLDRMYGGAGRDVFDYNRVAETGRTAAAADVIVGFVAGTDRIDLSTLDANTLAGGNQAFKFIGSSAFSGAGQLRFAGGVVYGSTDADATAEFAIKLSGVASVTAGDFIL